jgi:hypothetical protein
MVWSSSVLTFWVPNKSQNSRLCSRLGMQETQDPTAETEESQEAPGQKQNEV